MSVLSLRNSDFDTFYLTRNFLSLLFFWGSPLSKTLSYPHFTKATGTELTIRHWRQTPFRRNANNIPHPVEPLVIAVMRTKSQQRHGHYGTSHPVRLQYSFE